MRRDPDTTTFTHIFRIFTHIYTIHAKYFSYTNILPCEPTNLHPTRRNAELPDKHNITSFGHLCRVLDVKEVPHVALSIILPYINEYWEKPCVAGWNTLIIDPPIQ